MAPTLRIISVNIAISMFSIPLPDIIKQENLICFFARIEYFYQVSETVNRSVKMLTPFTPQISRPSDFVEVNPEY